MTEAAQKRVLVLEDEEPLRRLWVRILERAGYDSAGADNAGDMRGLLAAAPAHVLLCDVHLPGESGMSLVREVRDEFPDLAVLMVSGVHDEDVAAEAIRLGAVGYLIKPVGPRQVLMSVANALQQREIDGDVRSERKQHEEELDARDGEIESVRQQGRETEQRATASERRVREREAVATELRRRSGRFERLCALQRAITPQAPLADIADALASGGRELVDAELAEVWMLDPDGEREINLLAAVQGIDGATPGHAKMGEGVAARALAGSAVVATDADAGAEELGTRLTNAGATCALGVPLHEGGAIAGVLVIGSRTAGREFSAEDRDILRMLADHADLVLAARRASEGLGPAFRDPVTRLPSRAAFIGAVERALAAAPSDEAPTAVGLVGIDGFLAIDQEPERDSLAKRTADAAGAVFDGTIGYLGGGRFAVLLDGDAGRADPTLVGERVRREIQAAAGGRTVSMGIAYDETDADLLLRHAGAALVRARRAGGNQCARFHVDHRATVRADESLEAQLIGAVDSNTIEVRYMPIVSLAHRTLDTLRVLPRWRAGARQVAPALFQPLAEEIGIADAIGRRVMSLGCEQAVAWSERSPIGRPTAISIKLLPSEWRRSEVVDDVRAALATSGLSPTRLILEIDEHVVAQFDPALFDSLRDIADTGVRLAIDDFGAGALPIDYLEALPISLLRASRDLIVGIGEDPESEALLRSVAEAAATYGIVVLAQGVETIKQLVKLRGIGCELGEGPFFALPLDAATITRMIERGSAGSGRRAGAAE